MKKYFEPEAQILSLNEKDVICNSPVFNDDPEGGVGTSVGYGNLR